MKSNLESGLQTLLDVEVAMLETWLSVQASNAESMANSYEIRECIYHLIGEPGETISELKDAAEIQWQLDRDLAPFMASHDYVGYFITDKTKEILAASHSELVGRDDVREYMAFLSRVMEGETVVSPPFESVVGIKVASGELRQQQPTMYVCAPIRNRNFQVVGALALQIRPEREFTRILQLGRFGDSGETYAFGKDGRIVSNSRFDDDLILLGLLPDEEESQSILKLQIRDPLGDMTAGYRPNIRRADLPLTKMAASAVEGNSAVDVNGYRDYRGVEVVGAWTWIPEFEIGVATEVDYSQAFEPLNILQRTFWILFAMLCLCALAIFGFTLIVARLRREAQKAAVEAQQLGQYKLEEKLGAGAMGVVYKAYHAMLRRPTAVKLLDIDRVNETSISRFEREVQITCQLNHPNTVAIFDFGRTPEGIFYYAMEYLDGIDLQTLIEQYGPQEEKRVIHILQQICGSLYEAHKQGLVHRDIKPANTMLNRRGFEPDVVKVLDFGLVKALDEERHANSTSAGSLTGTPQYMSPESIQNPTSVDARADIYAVGAVGYYLLTGKPVFPEKSVVELCNMHVNEVPQPPSERLGKPVSKELEHALMSCLEKSRAKRPQTARDLADLLSKSPEASLWSTEDADRWWSQHERGPGQSTLRDSLAPSTEPKTYEQTMVSKK
ncbi:MAG: serine/threonine protein kinase [Planctomycetota bacterium]|nr:serine/threonine protein kinase [Planctomycetota bacterium]